MQYTADIYASSHLYLVMLVNVIWPEILLSGLQPQKKAHMQAWHQAQHKLCIAERNK